MESKQQARRVFCKLDCTRPQCSSAYKSQQSRLDRCVLLSCIYFLWELYALLFNVETTPFARAGGFYEAFLEKQYT